MSFYLIGHTSDLSIISQISISLHVVIIAWWLGSLWPLWLACSFLPNSKLKQVMAEFGRYASYLVLSLIVCGIVVGYQLLGSIHALFFSDYGQVFLIKLVFFSVLIGIASLHKYKLVPQLNSALQGTVKLQGSIKYEIYIAVFVLITTACLTTLVGPSQ